MRLKSETEILPHYEKLAVHKDFLLPNIESQRLEEIVSDIEKEKKFRILGYILMPIIIGFFILKIVNDKITILEKNKDELTNGVINELETSNNQIKNNLKHLIYADAYPLVIG